MWFYNLCFADFICDCFQFIFQDEISKLKIFSFIEIIFAGIYKWEWWFHWIWKRNLFKHPAEHSLIIVPTDNRDNVAPTVPKQMDKSVMGWVRKQVSNSNVNHSNSANNIYCYHTLLLPRNSSESTWDLHSSFLPQRDESSLSPPAEVTSKITLPTPSNCIVASRYKFSWTNHKL